MKLTLRFFASVRETVGTGQEALQVAADVATVAELRAMLAARGGVWADALAPQRLLRTACNQIMCDPETRLTDGCEVAFFPPVTGG